MIRKMLAAYCCIQLAMPASAQEKRIYPPLVSAKSVQEQLFKIPDENLKHHFIINFDKGDFLMVEFNKLSDWSRKEDFDKVMDISSKVVKTYRDSLKNELSSKHIDIHIPIKDEPLITRFSQSFENSNLLSISKEETTSLKMNMDTVRIIKNVGVSKDKDNKGDISIQYTFLLRDINTMNKWVTDEEWRSGTANVIDSVVRFYKRQWTRPDAWFHRLYVNYNPSDSGEKLTVSKRLNEEDNVFVGRVLTLNGGFGVSLVRSALCPNADIGMSYYFYASKKGAYFTRLSMNTFMSFEQRPDKSYKAFSTSFVNAEVGVSSITTNSVVPFYSVSLGVGYKLVTKDMINRDPSMSYNMYKMFFNYGLSKSIIISPEIVGNLRKKENYNGWIGLTMNLRLF